MRFGTIYFHHLQDDDYVGPALSGKVGASFVQLDTSDVSLWHQIHCGPDSYDWNILDRAYDLCAEAGLEAVPSLSHHFVPPAWIKDGPFNDETIETPQYARFGPQFECLTALQKAFADFVTALVERYCSRTQLYILSHEWNLSQEMFKTEDNHRNDILLANQLGCTMLAFKIIKEYNSSAKLAYGLLNLHRRKPESDRSDNSFIEMMESWPFGPRYMIKQFVDTGDEDFLNVLATTYVFHLGYSDAAEGFGTIYLDDSVEAALEELWNSEVTLDGRVFRYRDYIQEMIVSPFTLSTYWMANPNRPYSESEQAEFLANNVSRILQLVERGIPISRIVVTLNDKNEDWSEFAPERWIYVPEGLHKICGFENPLRHGPTDWTIKYEPKQAVEVFRSFAREKQ